MSSPVKDTPPTFAEQQMLEKQRRYSQLLDDEGSDEVAGYTLTLEGCAPVVVRHDVSTQHTLGVARHEARLHLRRRRQAR